MAAGGSVALLLAAGCDQRLDSPFVTPAAAMVAPGTTQPAHAAPTAEQLAQYKKQLSPEAYHVLFEAGTEMPFRNAYHDNHAEGTYVSAVTGAALFSSEDKFDSGTGWPSFTAPLAGHVETKRDFKLVWPRTEYHCARCDGHQGHVFSDGPKPTGLRYCNNGVALRFEPA